MSAQPLLPHDERKRACPKCGCDAWYDETHYNKVVYCGRCCTVVFVEHLHVTCWRCGFWWFTHTRDYVPEPAPIEVPEPLTFEQQAEREVEELLN